MTYFFGIFQWIVLHIKTSLEIHSYYTTHIQSYKKVAGMPHPLPSMISISLPSGKFGVKSHPMKSMHFLNSWWMIHFGRFVGLNWLECLL